MFQPLMFQYKDLNSSSKDLISWLVERKHRRMLVISKDGVARWIGIAAEDPKPYLDFLLSVVRERGYRVLETEELYVVVKHNCSVQGLWVQQLYIMKPKRFGDTHVFFIFIPRHSELKELPQMLLQHFSFAGIDYAKI